MNKKKQIASKIKEARKKLGLSQTDLALKTFCTQPYISRLENGTASLPSELLPEFSKALGKEVYYFLGDF